MGRAPRGEAGSPLTSARHRRATFAQAGAALRGAQSRAGVLTDSAATRTRDIYAGIRGDGALRYRELRVLRSGRYVGLTVQRSFGG